MAGSQMYFTDTFGISLQMGVYYQIASGSEKLYDATDDATDKGTFIITQGNQPFCEYLLIFVRVHLLSISYWYFVLKTFLIKRVVIEITGVCDVVTTLHLLRFTLIKFAIHRSIFPKRSGRSYLSVQTPIIGLNLIFARFMNSTIGPQVLKSGFPS